MYTHTHSAREEIEDENRRSTAEAGLDNKNFSDTVIELKCTVVGLLSSVVATVFFQCQQCPDDGVLKLVPPPQTSKVTKRLAEHGKRTHTHTHAKHSNGQQDDSEDDDDAGTERLAEKD